MHAWLIAALVVSWVMVGILAGLLFVLMKQHGSLILHQEELEHRLEHTAFQNGREWDNREPQGAGAEQRAGLPVGSEAPDFALPDLEGAEHTLQSYLGQPFVLTFFSMDCGYCKQMSPSLGKLGKKGHPMVLLSHGSVDAHKELARSDNWRCDVVVEEAWDVAGAYEAIGTPSGYLIDSEGRIASELALGGDAVLALVDAEPIEPAANGNGGQELRQRIDGSFDGEEIEAQAAGGATALKTRDVAESKIRRDGLDKGTIAPSFVLPDLAGKSHSLVDYRGKRVLLVFSDVTCGPCELLAPELVRLYESRPEDLEIVMVSRGDLEENKLKAKTFGYPFPVLVQKGWEVSKQYAMFATPVAYLIDADGIIVADVAMGPEAILALPSA
jgi:peroxiredoxin